MSDSASPAAAYHRRVIEEKRAAILDAALSCFLERGVAGASLGRIAREAEVSTATLYRHFPTKDELLGQVLVRAALMQPPPALDVLPAGAPGAGLSQLADHYERMLLSADMLTLVRTLVAEVPRLPQLGRQLERHGHGPFVALLRKYLERETAAGTLVVEDAQIAAEQFLGMISSVLFWPTMVNAARWPSADKIARTRRTAIDTFMARYARRD